MSPPGPLNEPSGTEDFAVQIATIQPRLYGFILKRLADREQTLEVLQRTNEVLCRKADDFQHGSSFTAWAFTIAKFQVMAFRKSEGSGRLIFSDKVSQLIDRTAADEAAAVDERIPVLRNCLERLPNADRELVQQRYRDGHPISLIAEAVSKSIDAIAMRLSRIRKQLAECVRSGLDQETGYEV
ncbi:RNA polymerase sigma factor [Rubripirellula lacrimiformis]|uniref:RNA polymerase sigma factor n=1 Tax=Rubripirellula lacrimiformis TaxID=1930273 RepID=A0A517NCT3_9BACT|nr:sigma-70 family RNA polymerase sigma factor [Rubripirellula lacrimiformis]QDT04949.1 RNA polymerase sigma factor [Rubripirellula lacrimiformis]